LFAPSFHCRFSSTVRIEVSSALVVRLGWTPVSAPATFTDRAAWAFADRGIRTTYLPVARSW
jgi:hypothetical protein